VTSEPVLVVDDIRKRYGEIDAVAGLSFAVLPGEIFGLLGPNGAGKTTTLRMLMGITAPDRGTVRHHGGALDRRRVGYLPEERGLFEDAPVLDTLAYLGSLRGMSLAAARAAALPLLERFELAGRAREKVNTLSKGNQQKVQLAAAILHRPTLAVLDEPFSGLDPLNQETFIAMLRELRDQGTAVLLSAHHLDLVERLADRFLLMAQGRAAIEGTLEDMRRRITGGLDEMVRLVVAGRDGTPLDVPALTQALRAAIPDGRVEVHAAGDTVRVEVLVRHGVDQAPLLAAVAARAAILRVESRPVPLHEIYLRAVGGSVTAADVGAAGAPAAHDTALTNREGRDV
jgi:ABC-2 type transport system ATP-binding protein